MNHLSSLCRILTMGYDGDVDYDHYDYCRGLDHDDIAHDVEHDYDGDYHDDDDDQHLCSRRRILTMVTSLPLFHHHRSERQITHLLCKIVIYLITNLHYEDITDTSIILLTDHLKLSISIQIWVLFFETNCF